MSDDIKRIDAGEFRELGFLQEANRLFFHPHGLALEVVRNEDGSYEFGGVWDYRDDPEGIVFTEPPDKDKTERVLEEYNRHLAPRLAMFGYALQPVGVGWKSDHPNGEGE